MTMNLSVRSFEFRRAALSSNPTLRSVPLAAALRRYGPGTLCGKTAPFKTNLDRSIDDEKAEPPEHHISRVRDDRGIQCWAHSCSLAATKEMPYTISVGATTTGRRQKRHRPAYISTRAETASQSSKRSSDVESAYFIIHDTRAYEPPNVSKRADTMHAPSVDFSRRRVATHPEGTVSNRSGPGYFSTDRNVRSKCRCSNVSCSSHYDAQLTAFFIDREPSDPPSRRSRYILPNRDTEPKLAARILAGLRSVLPATRENRIIRESAGARPRRSFNGLPGPLGQGEHADSFSVARVRPRTSKGITDLLLLNLVRLEAAGPSKKNFNTSPVSCVTEVAHT
ncbi:unnamed protein product, partial [Iphiclides podalirius]